VEGYAFDILSQLVLWAYTSCGFAVVANFRFAADIFARLVGKARRLHHDKSTSNRGELDRVSAGKMSRSGCWDCCYERHRAGI